MTHIQPDFEWYRNLSTERHVPARCPLANVHKCPRFYQSISLLGDVGITTSIAGDKDAELLERWRQSEHWPVVAEHATSIMGSPEEKTGFYNFCPEVAYDVFHLFALYLHRYADEIDRDFAHRQLKDSNRKPNDWRWNWSSVEPLHYTDCPLYSLLSVQVPSVEKQTSERKVLQLRPSVYGISLNLDLALEKLKKWWKSRKN